MMVENLRTVSNGEHKDKNPPKLKRRKSKHEGKHKPSSIEATSTKKEKNIEKISHDDMEWDTKSDNFSPRADWEAEIQRIDSKASASSTWDPKEFQQQTDNVDAWNEWDEPTRVMKDQSSPSLGEGSSNQRTLKKGKRSSRKKAEKASLEKSNSKLKDRKSSPTRRKSLASDGEVEKKEKKQSSNRSVNSNVRKEDKRPSMPRRSGERSDTEDMPPSKPRNRRKETLDDTATTDDDELVASSFHSLRIDADKPKPSSKDARRRKSSSNRRAKTPTGGRPNRRRIKNKSDDEIPDKSTHSSDEMSSTHEVDVKVERAGRLRSDRRKERDQPATNNENGHDTRRKESKVSPPSRFARNSISRRGGIRRSHSERLTRRAGNPDSEGADDSNSITRRAHESLNRANGSMSRSAHSRKIRRHHSSGLSRMTGSLNTRSAHSTELERWTANDGRRTPRRASRRHQKFDSAGSIGEDSVESFGDGRSQSTLESIDDFEDFGEDFYGMELQTPGMIDFEEDMLDLMQRANPEVTEHLDRRVHRKRENVAFDRNMPMMTRQALLTRQASSQIQRQFFDGSSIDKKRLLLRNDSSHSHKSHDGLALSSHRGMRGPHVRRAPPRTRSSGMGLKQETDDRRRVFRSRSMHGGQPASFNQQYQNKPNKVRSLTRRASGDLIQPHTVRGLPRGSDHATRRRAIQRSHSLASQPQRKPSLSDNFTLRQPHRKLSKGKSRHQKDDGGSDSDDTAMHGSPSTFASKSPSHDSPRRASSIDGKLKFSKASDKKDMANKRNRSKLHLLMYKTKMGVDMDSLFRKIHEGEIPRSPIDSLRMPSP